jgi:2,4-dienoyl-CoA reductase-like NADH-dependent reductase (Old Yellow Enzyme family)
LASALFSPLDLKTLRLENHIVVSSMCQYSATDGSASAWHRAHLGMLAGSGAGLLMMEATAVSAEGRISWGDLGLYSDANEHALADVLEGVREFSAMPIGLQLCHAGRKASSEKPWLGGKLIPADDPHGWQPLGVSAIAMSASEPPPLALDHAGLARVRDDFVASARRAARIGLDALQLHFAHGYLMHQFLSPITNQRSDAYGGSLENRLRFPLEVFAAVRAAWPDKPLGIRVSATDWIEGGWDLPQTVELARQIQSLGCDWIDVSSGGIAHQQKIPVGIGYQLPFAREVRRATGMLTSTVGLITEPKQAEQIVATGDADLVTLARAMLWDPHWPWHAAAELGASVTAPPQYWRSQPHGVRDVFTGWKASARRSGQ